MRNLVTATRVLCAFILVLIAGGCSDTSPTGSSTDTPVTITGEFFIQAKINGKTETMQIEQQALSGTGEYFSGASGYGSGDKYPVMQEIGFARTTVVNMRPVIDTSYRSIRIALVKVYDDRPWEDEEYDLLLPSTGSMKFGSEEKMIDGVEIRWTDAAGTRWSSALGSADQTGSSVVITNRVFIQLPAGYVGPIQPRYKVKGTFNCKLYDGKGNMMEVTNGTFHLRMIYPD